MTQSSEGDLTAWETGCAALKCVVADVWRQPEAVPKSEF